MSSDEGWLSFEITADDVRRYAATMRNRRWRSSGRTRLARISKWMLIASAVAVVVLGTLITVAEGDLAWARAMGDNPLLRALALLVVGVAALFGAVALLVPQIAVWQASRRRDVIGSRRMRIGEDGLHVVTPSSTSVLRWKGVIRVEREGEDLLVFIDPEQAILIPGRAFESRDAQREFADECRTRIRAARTTLAD